MNRAAERRPWTHVGTESVQIVLESMLLQAFSCILVHPMYNPLSFHDEKFVPAFQSKQTVYLWLMLTGGLGPSLKVH